MPRARNQAAAAKRKQAPIALQDKSTARDIPMLQFRAQTSLIEMQSSDPAARPGPKFRDRAFCGAWAKSAGLMPGFEEVITMYYALAAELRAVFERC